MGGNAHYSKPAGCGCGIRNARAMVDAAVTLPSPLWLNTGLAAAWPFRHRGRLMTRQNRFGLGLGVLLTCLLAPAAQAQTAGPPGSEASPQQVRELLHLVGMDTIQQQMNAQMTAVMQRALPCVPASYWQGFVDADATRHLIDLTVPVYQKHFTAQDLDGLLAFYRSPLGQKMIRVTPLITAERIQIARQWGQQRGTQMMADLKAKGTLDDKGQCPAAPAANK